MWIGYHFRLTVCQQRSFGDGQMNDTILFNQRNARDNSGKWKRNTISASLLSCRIFIGKIASVPVYKTNGAQEELDAYLLSAIFETTSRNEKYRSDRLLLWSSHKHKQLLHCTNQRIHDCACSIEEKEVRKSVET